MGDISFELVLETMAVSDLPACITWGKKELGDITHYQRNANQNHNEVPFDSSQNGCDPKVYKQ